MEARYEEEDRSDVVHNRDVVRIIEKVKKKLVVEHDKVDEKN
ncbi:MAG: hypothetical protein ACRC5T_05285 [Cetobacterium sp.]